MRDYWYENDFFILTQTKLIFTKKKPLHFVNLVSVHSEVMFILYRITFRVELEKLVHNAHQTSGRRRSCWPTGFGELNRSPYP